MTTLHTARLVLRPFQAADEAAMLAYRNDPAVARYQGWPLPFTAALFAGLLDGERRGADTGWHRRAIVRDGEVIGDVALRPDGHQAELGISLAGHAQGHGYAAEALAALTGHAFDEVGVARLFARVDPANAAVIGLLLRSGWRLEGISRGTYWHRDHWADDATYALERPPPSG